MTEKVFADTNIVIYAESRHAKKSPAAVAILEASPVISTQVVSETVSVLTRKHGFAHADANQVAPQEIPAEALVRRLDSFTRLRIPHDAGMVSPYYVNTGGNHADVDQA